MLRHFVVAWTATRPTTGGSGARVAVDVPFISPLQWLSNETGIPKKTVQNVMRGRAITTELRVADALIAAIGCPEALHDGTLEILPNTNATKKAQATCCSGSTIPVAVRPTLDMVLAEFAPRG